MNKIIRKCDRCDFQGDQNDGNFMYLGDDVWSCSRCYSKYTHIFKIIDTDNK